MSRVSHISSACPRPRRRWPPSRTFYGFRTQSPAESELNGAAPPTREASPSGLLLPLLFPFISIRCLRCSFKHGFDQVRRTKISERMKKLQEVVPNMDKVSLTSDATAARS